MLCPSCTNMPCKRSLSKWYELPLLLVLVQTWACPHCFRRFRRPVLWFGNARCRRCEKRNCKRSTLRWFDWPLLLLGMRPWRCRGCKGRFYRAIVWI